MTNLINELVYLITGTSNPTENMVQGSVDQDTDNTVGMAADSFEMGRIDQAAVISQYHWYWDRGLELENLDKEQALINNSNSYRYQKAQHINKMSQYIPKANCYWKHTQECRDNKARLDKMLFEIKAAVKALDESFMPYQDMETHIDKMSKSEANLNYVSDSVDNWDLGTCAVALDEILLLKRNKELNGKDYNVAKGLILRKLANNAPTHYEVPRVSSNGYDYTISVSTEWHEDLQSCIEVFRDTDIKAPGYDDRFFGEMKYDAEAVIDMRRANPHLSIDEAIYCVNAGREEPEAFIPNMGL